MSDKTSTVPVVLTRHHKHAGKPHAAGATIHVPPADADWLEAKAIGKRAEPGEPVTGEIATTTRRQR